MQDLDSQIRAAIRRLGITNGTVVDSLSNLVPILSVLLTLVITVATVLTGLDDSDDAGPDEPPIVVPVVNEQMRTDLVRAINYHRIVPASFNLELHASAQEKATDNATGGRLGTATAAESQIVMLQARQSTDIASVDGFLTMWMEDYPNYEVLMHEDNESFGVGIAEANGQTYAVVQFMQR